MRDLFYWYSMMLRVDLRATKKLLAPVVHKVDIAIMQLVSIILSCRLTSAIQYLNNCAPLVFNYKSGAHFVYNSAWLPP